MIHPVGILRKQYEGTYRITLNEQGEFAQIKKKGREWHAEIRYRDGTLKQHAGIWKSRKDAVEEVYPSRRENPMTATMKRRRNTAAPKKVKITLKHDRDFNEYQVRVRKDGVLDEDGTYFTDWKDDAVDTAHEMAKFFRAGGAEVELGAGLGQKSKVNPAKSKAQFRWAHAAYKRGDLTKKQLDKIIEGTNYRKLPARVGKKKGSKMPKNRRKKTKAQIKRERLKNLAKARRAKAAKGRRSTTRRKPAKRRTSVRRRKNFKISDLPPAAFTKAWYKVDGVKKKITVVQAAALRNKGHSVVKADPPVKRGPRKKKRKTTTKRKSARKSTRKGGKRKTSRRAYQKSSSSARRWYKVGVEKKYITKASAERYRKQGKKVRQTKAPVGKRGTSKGMKRKTARKAYRPKRRTSRKKKTKAQIHRERLKNLKKARAARKRKSGTKKRRTPTRTRSGRKKTKAQIHKERLKNLKKARAARKRKASGRSRPRKKLGKRTVTRRAISSVRRKRPKAKRSRVRRTVLRDARRKVHKRGRKRSVKHLARDARFEMDFADAFKRQNLGRSRHQKKLRSMKRHPSHLDKRRTTPSTRRGWKEFAGYPPNTVATIGKSPVKGSFNGVLIDEIHGKLAHSGRSVTIKPPKGAPLYFIWTAGGRSFEIVGPVKSVTSLAKGMARGGEPILITRLNYLAPTYAVPAGTRRTGKETMYVAYTHKMKHKAYISWNELSGSKARFPIITKGTRGKSMVNRSGIIL